ncbi:putative nuclear RNA export factor SDE5 [Psychroserpens sp. SPM9]|uniref:putative nuclear RNA export factor SDE5 n=1 Tax=Psychroserpens sp. SPM9 TaxID=2975598 RepID=UPI0021A2F409|nr:putative nuclear RNA export factor SDE5 [Psychroserpens sp. SPM9]MDG5490850.1 putative nuclear RNA export factor SDE5 [Psychroserpens sp. SPM9]
MADDNKNLSDDLNDMLGDAKDTAKRAGDKISSSAKEFSEDAKEFANEAKEKASEFADDAKEVLSDGKNVAIIAHITIIGFIIALVMNGSNKTDYGSFYIRQMLGLCILSLSIWVLSLIVPLLGFLSLLTIILWIMSLIGALSGEKKPVFLLGEQFQEWFKSI